MSASVLLVLTISVTYALNMCLQRVAGIYFILFQDEFDATATEISFVLGLTTSVFFLGGPVNAVTYKLIGPEISVYLSTGIVAVGYIGSSLSQSILSITIFQGVLLGFGSGLTYITVFTILSEAFNENRVFINNLVCCVEVSFAVILGPLIQYLIPYFTWRGVILLQGGLVLNSIPLGRIAVTQFRKIKRDNLNRCSKINDNDKSVHGNEESSFSSNKKTTKNLVKAKNHLCKIFEWTLLKNPIFGAYCISCLGIFVASNITTSYIVRYAQDVGIDDQIAAILMSLFLATTFAVNLLLGFVSMCNFVKKSKFTKSQFLSLVCFLQSIILLMPIFLEDTISYSLYVALLGIAYGSVGSLPLALIPEYFGVEKMAEVLGFRFFSTGVLILMFPPFIGKLVDIVGNYKPVQYVCAVMSVAGGIILLILQWRLSRQKIK